MGLLLLFCIGCSKKYAILISTGTTTVDDNNYHSEYWYDAFLHYKMLRDNGFDDDKIYLLYGNGTDFNTAHAQYNATSVYGHSITDMATTKANIQAVFDTLSGKVTTKDYLYVWWMGHGGGSGVGSCDLSMSVSTTGESVTDAEFKTYLDAVTNYKKRSVAVMTCHSGGMVNNFTAAGTNTVILTSSNCTENSFSFNAAGTCNGLVHAEFSYTLPNALLALDPCGSSVASDADANGFVSLDEAHQYNVANVPNSTPQMGNPDAIAASTFIQKQTP
jgi:hypothetical protein